MKCPSCSAALPDAAPRCNSCKFNLRAADLEFGAAPRCSAYLTDQAGQLSLNDAEKLREELTRFAHQFPQIPFSVFLTELRSGQSAAEYAFWLANRAPSGAAAHSGAENLALLLLLDLTHHAAALAGGYGLETILEERDFERVLTTMARAFSDGEFAHAISLAIEEIAEILREHSERESAAIASPVSSDET